jgi:asparagine synthase (glutamine-hydrolysing)
LTSGRRSAEDLAHRRRSGGQGDQYRREAPLLGQARGFVCGIAGLYDPIGDTPAEKLGHEAQEMAEALSHRGPDDAGLWTDPDGRVALGHRRLAVVGLGPGGHQPMVSSDGRWVLAYNGEVYNFGSLRHRVTGEGCRLRGGSDTEVLLAAVQLWGLDRALDSCEGLFALALWDRVASELHLARDRFGEKPLYYGWVGGRLAFASELKALARLQDFAPALDHEALALYMRHDCVPAPRSIYSGVAKLCPGQVLTAGRELRPRGQPELRSYWDALRLVEEARARPLRAPAAELCDRLEEALSDAVAARMVADVPVGAFLSGGVDSSLVVALMRSRSSAAVRTFTVGFEDRAFDESVEAAAVAAHLGTDHTSLQVSDADAAGAIPDLPGTWDEPFADVSQIPVLLVSALARRHVTVSLTGDGGDELFGGYNRHASMETVWRRAAVLPPRLRRLAGSALGTVPPGVVEACARLPALVSPRWRVRNPSTKVAKLAKVMSADGPEEAYLSLVSHWDDPAAIVHGSSGSLDGLSLAAKPAQWPALSGVTEQMLWLDLVGYLPDDILVKVDRAAMSVSLETRAPFLDRRVFDLAWSLPMEMKLRNGTTKWLLREVLHRHVPEHLVDRPKMGFGIPIGAWLRGRLREWAEDLLAEGRLRRQGILEPDPIRRAWRQHLRGRRDLGYELWDVLAFQAWLDRWMPGATA